VWISRESIRERREAAAQIKAAAVIPVYTGNESVIGTQICFPEQSSCINITEQVGSHPQIMQRRFSKGLGHFLHNLAKKEWPDCSNKTHTLVREKHLPDRTWT
jgi:hypothetical protein